MRKLIGYKLSCPTGSFYDPILKVKATHDQILPVSALEGKNLVGTIFDQWRRDGGFLPVYEVEGGATAPLIPKKVDYSVLSKNELMKIASEQYEPATLKKYTKEDLIALLTGE